MIYRYKRIKPFSALTDTLKLRLICECSAAKMQIPQEYEGKNEGAIRRSRIGPRKKYTLSYGVSSFCNSSSNSLLDSLILPRDKYESGTYPIRRFACPIVTPA